MGIDSKFTLDSHQTDRRCEWERELLYLYLVVLDGLQLPSPSNHSLEQWFPKWGVKPWWGRRAAAGRAQHVRLKFDDSGPICWRDKNKNETNVEFIVDRDFFTNLKKQNLCFHRDPSCLSSTSGMSDCSAHLLLTFSTCCWVTEGAACWDLKQQGAARINQPSQAVNSLPKGGQWGDKDQELRGGRNNEGELQKCHNLHNNYRYKTWKSKKKKKHITWVQGVFVPL